MLPIEIQMHNKGKAPANDIDIWLHFPDGFVVINEDEFPRKPKEPALPYKPKNRFDLGSGNYLGVPNLSHLNPRVNLPAATLTSRPDIRKTNSYEVNIHRKNLKHFHKTSLDTLLVVYPSFSEIISFTIDYRIIVNNVPEPVIGNLSVVAS